MKKLLNSRYSIIIIVTIFLFVMISYLVQENIEAIKAVIVGRETLGIFLYIFITMASIVLAPINTIPLIPFAANVWGWFWAGIFSLLGWVMGAAIAFLLARKLGLPVLKKFFSLKFTNKVEDKIPENISFWGIIVLRLAMPIDILSYALGFFSRISFSKFILATIIGVTPFAFLYTFLGALPIYIQVASILIAATLIGVVIFIKKRGKIRHK